MDKIMKRKPIVIDFNDTLLGIDSNEVIFFEYNSTSGICRIAFKSGFEYRGQTNVADGALRAVLLGLFKNDEK